MHQRSEYSTTQDVLTQIFQRLSNLRRGCILFKRNESFTNKLVHEIYHVAKKFKCVVCIQIQVGALILLSKRSEIIYCRRSKPQWRAQFQLPVLRRNIVTRGNLWMWPWTHARFLFPQSYFEIRLCSKMHHVSLQWLNGEATWELRRRWCRLGNHHWYAWRGSRSNFSSKRSDWISTRWLRLTQIYRSWDLTDRLVSWQQRLKTTIKTRPRWRLGSAYICKELAIKLASSSHAAQWNSFAMVWM